MRGISLKWGYPQSSSILTGCSILNHPFGGTPIYGNPHVYTAILEGIKDIPGLHSNRLFVSCVLVQKWVLIVKDEEYRSYIYCSAA